MIETMPVSFGHHTRMNVTATDSVHIIYKNSQVWCDSTGIITKIFRAVFQQDYISWARRPARFLGVLLRPAQFPARYTPHTGSQTQRDRVGLKRMVERYRVCDVRFAQT